MSIIFYISEATCFYGRLLMHNHGKDQLTLLLYKQTSLTFFVLKALIDLYFLDLSRKPTFLLLSRPPRSILHTKQVELAPVHRKLHKIHSFHKDANVPTNKTNFKIA